MQPGDGLRQSGEFFTGADAADDLANGPIADEHSGEIGLRAEKACGTRVSSRRASPIAAKIMSTASSRVSRNHVMSGVIIVTGPPLRICSWNSGITEPLDASTFP